MEGVGGSGKLFGSRVGKVMKNGSYLEQPLVRFIHWKALLAPSNSSSFFLHDKMQIFPKPGSDSMPGFDFL